MSSGAIKGITVEIGGDTTKLGKALGNSEKSTRSLQVELRQIEKLLQFDPTNTELLIQKQNVLADSVLETSKKLDTLKEAEAQVVAQFEKGDIGEDQLRAFQREILQTEKSLNSMKAELKTATENLELYGDNNGVAKVEAAKLEKQIQEQNDALEAEKRALQEAEKAQKEHAKAVEDAKKKLDDFKDSAKDAFEVVGKGALALGGAAVATGGYALKLSTDFDKALNTLVTRTGASADEMDELNTAMENVYANNFGESIEDVAESMATVKQNTKLSGNELQNATERALLLRDTFEFDVNESTRAAKMLMDQYGMSAEDAYNLIAQGAQNGLDKNGDLLDTINEYAVHFEGLGYTAEDMFNMLVNGAENGTFSVDKLGDAVKEFGIRAKDGTAAEALKDYRKSLGLSTKDVKRLSAAMAEGGEEGKAAMQEVVASVFKIEDPVKRNTVGVQLFGTMWEDLGEEGVKALMNVEGEISTTKNALDDINEQKYDDIGSALQGLGRTLETDVIKPLGDELKPVVEEAIGYVQENGPQIREVLSGIVEKIGDFVGFIVNNSSAILATIAGIGTGLLVWNVVSMITGVVNAIKAFKLANEGATVAQWLLNAAMNANPIGIIITVIAAVVAAIVAFIATNDNARAKFLEIWENIKTACGNAIDAIVNFFTVTIPNAWNSFLAWLPGFISGIVNWFSQLPGRIWAWLSNVVTRIVTWGSNMKARATTAVSSLISSVVTWFAGLPGKIWTWLSNVITRVVTWGSNMKARAVTAASTLVSSVVTWMSQLPGKIQTAIQGAITRVVTWGSNLKNRATTAARNMVTNVYNAAKEIPSKVWSAIQGAIQKVTSWGSQMLLKARQAVRKVATAIVDKLKGVPDDVMSVGKNIVSGLWDGIGSKVDWIIEKVKGFGDSVLQGLKDFFGIHSPSRVMAAEVGKPIAEGVIEGVDSQKKNAEKSAKELSKIYVSAAKTKVEKLKDANAMSLSAEIEFWQEIRDHCVKGSSAYNTATKAIKTAKKELNTELKALDKQYEKDVKAIQEQLTKDIKAVTDAYDSAVASRGKSIRESLTLFESFTPNDAVAQNDLISNLESQVNALSEWNTVLDQLANREGMNAELLSELESMNVDSLNTLKEINAMSDEQLAQYIELFEEKSKIANERAAAEQETQIKLLTETANKQLEALSETYSDNLAELGVSMSESSTEIGENMVAGIMEGLEMQSGPFKAFLESYFAMIVETAKESLDINSPSRIFANVIGKQIPAGVAQGITNNAKVATDAVKNMADGLIDPSINGATIDRKLNATFGASTTDNTAANSSAMLDKLEGIYERLNRLQIVLDTGTLVGETIDKIDAGLATKQLLSARGV